MTPSLRGRSAARPARPQFRPTVHVLEARDVPAVDLVLTLDAVPAAVPTDQNFTVSFTDTNAGPDATDTYWTDRIVLSADDVYGNADDLVLLNIGVGSGGYPAGTAFPVSTRVQGEYTRGLAPGSYTLFVATNVDNTQPETDEGNNLASAPIEVTPPPDVDLTVTGIGGPAELLTGQGYTIPVTVANSGTEPALELFYVNLYVSADDALDAGDQFVGGTPVLFDPVAPGEVRSVDVAADSYYTRFLTPGSFYLIAKADATGDQAETDEGNNTRAVAVTVAQGPTPDLTPTAFAVAQAEVPSSGTIDATWTVADVGDGDAGYRYDVLWLSADEVLDGTDVYLGGPFVDGVPAGGASDAAQSVAVTAAPGDYFVLLQVDYYGNVIETDEGNNVAAVPLRVTRGGPAPLPDLAVAGVTAPAVATAGGGFEVTYTAANGGGDLAAIDWYDAVYLSADAAFDAGDRLLASVYPGNNYTTGLLSGGTYASGLTVPGFATAGVAAGDYYLLVVADQFDTVVESDEGNNALAVPLTVVPAPDVDLVAEVTAAPATLVLGDGFSVTYRVTNAGADAVDPLGGTDVVYLSADPYLDAEDRALASVNPPDYAATLAAGGSYEATVYVYGYQVADLPAGSYYLLAVADRYEQQAESDEGNNTAAAAVELTAAPVPDADLVVSAVTLDGGPAVVVGGRLVVSWTVTNRGSEATTAATTRGWYDAVYLSADDALDPATDLQLDVRGRSEEVPAGGTYSNSIDVYLPYVSQYPYVPGTYYVFVLADAPGLQPESDETNNTSAPTPLTVTAPDLAVTAAEVPAGAVAGGEVRLRYTVTNVGDAATLSSSWYDTLVLSTDAVYEPGVDRALSPVTLHYGGLAAGGSYEEDVATLLPYDLPAGEYYAFVVADTPSASSDPNGFAYEADETNNAAGPFRLTVVEDTPPVVDPVPPLAVNEGETLTFTVTATDPDAPYDRVTQYLLYYPAPDGMTIDPATGVVTWTPTAAQAGRSYEFAVGAFDTASRAGSTPVTVRVYARPTDIFLRGNTVAENRPAGTPVGILSGTDPDGEPLTYTLVAGEGDNAAFRIVLTDPTAAAGPLPQLQTAGPLDFEAGATRTVVVRATDPRGLSVDRALTVAVTDVPDLVGFDVQQGAAERSFVRYVDVTADRPGLAAALVGKGRVRLVRADLAGGNPVVQALPKTGLSASGATLRVDVGALGLTRDGYYTLQFDLDGNGSYETGRSFYRLLGDTNGDRTVDAADLAAVRAAVAAGAYLPAADVNGDGRVDRRDVDLTYRARGQSLAPGLPLDD